MAKRALITVKDVSGVADLALALVNEFGFELIASEVPGEVLEAKEIEYLPVDEAAAAGWVGNGEKGVVLVIANFVEVQSVGRAFLSWKAALDAFDRAIVDTIRAAAWALDRMTVLGNQSDYAAALEELRNNGGEFSHAFRLEKATSALRAASEFDFAVAQYLEVQGAGAPDLGALSGYGKVAKFVWPRAELLDTGENRHQRAAVYGSFFDHFKRVAGGKLGYLEVFTISQAAHLIGEFEKATAALFQGSRIVAVHCSHDLGTAIDAVLKREEAKGSWLVVNGAIGMDRLRTALEQGITGFLAPDYAAEENNLLNEAVGICAVSSGQGLGYEALQEIRSVPGGALVQDRNRSALNPMQWKTLSLAQPLVEDWEALLFGAKVVRHANSAALAISSGEQFVCLEEGHYSPKRAWEAVEESGIGLANTVAVFDVPEVPPGVLVKMKELGVRAVLVPAGGDEGGLAAAANECGLVLLALGNGLRKL